MCKCGSDRPVVPRDVLSTLFNNGCIISLSPVTKDITCLSWLVKCRREWLGSCITPSGVQDAPCQEPQVCVCSRSSQTWLRPAMGATSLLQSLSWFSGTWAMLEDGLLLKTEGKKICWALWCSACWLSPAFLFYLPRLVNKEIKLKKRAPFL